MLDLARYDAVIFDLFHTLISVDALLKPGTATADILGVSREAWSEQLFERAGELARGVIKDHYQLMERLARALKPDVQEGVIRMALAARTSRFRQAHEYVPAGVEESLRVLKAQKKKLGLVSNVLAIDIVGWDRSPIRPLFDSIVLSCDVGYIKPEHRIYELCLDELGVRPERSVFVGDGNNDELRGAKELGMTTVLTRQFNGHLPDEKILPRRAYADFVISDIRELIGNVDRGKHKGMI